MIYNEEQLKLNLSIGVYMPKENESTSKLSVEAKLPLISLLCGAFFLGGVYLSTVTNKDNTADLKVVVSDLAVVVQSLAISVEVMNQQNESNKTAMTEVITMVKDNQKASTKNAGDIALMNLRVDMIANGRPTTPQPQPVNQQQSNQLAIKPKDYQ